MKKRVIENKKLKITLILAANSNDPLINKDPFMPLSLPILASVAPEHDYTLIDLLSAYEPINFNIPDDIIGISLRQSAESRAFEIADEFLKRGKTVILGGAQASAVPHRVKEHATSVVVGEAEELWPKLLNDFQKNELKEFYVCSPTPFDAKGHSVYQQENLPSLQNLPRPKRQLYKKKYTFDITFASRGCPIACDFCFVSDLYGKKMRFKPTDDVIADIKTFKRFYYLLDETVFGRPGSYPYYLELYEKIAALPKTRYWTGQINIDAAANTEGQKVIKKASEAGFVYAAAGIESINKTTLSESGALKKMGIKDSNDYLNQMKQNIAFIQQQGILISGWFTLGYDSDSIQTYYDTLDFCIETNILPVFTPIRAISGSRLWYKMHNEQRLQDINKNVSNIAHPIMSNADVIHGLKHAAEKGFSRKENFKRLKYHYRIFKKSEKDFNRVVYKTIFVHITQKRMKKIVHAEIKRLIERFEQNI